MDDSILQALSQLNPEATTLILDTIHLPPLAIDYHLKIILPDEEPKTHHIRLLKNWTGNGNHFLTVIEPQEFGKPPEDLVTPLELSVSLLEFIHDLWKNKKILAAGMISHKVQKKMEDVKEFLDTLPPKETIDD